MYAKSKPCREDCEIILFRASTFLVYMQYILFFHDGIDGVSYHKADLHSYSFPGWTTKIIQKRTAISYY